MRLLKSAFLGLSLALAGCASALNTSTSVPEVGQTFMTPYDAIFAAAEAAPEAVPGRFEIEVKAVGFSEERAFLNSEVDYRDPRCLTIAFTPRTLRQYRELHGDDLESRFSGKTIRVRGQASRVRIDFVSSSGAPTGKYYYQTHVDIFDLNQIEIVEDGVAELLL